MKQPKLSTRASLLADLRAIGIQPGDAVMVHAALRRLGRVLGGPDTLIDALVDAVGPQGTILGYCDWQLEEEALTDPLLRPQIPPFDPLRSRSSRENGAFPELLRTTPGALRSGNPGASVAALGHQAQWLTADHPLDYGYGPQSPLAKLVEIEGKVLMLGAPLDTMTLLHHAEHLAQVTGKRIHRGAVPIVLKGQTVWQEFTEFDTRDPVLEGLEEDYFGEIVQEFLQSGQGTRGLIGRAKSVLVEAPAMLQFAVQWLENWQKVRRDVG